jgi:hypothetical protein
MKKYNIEGNIDFFSELYKSLDDETKLESESDINLCLITNQPLTDKFVELTCGHKFNYISIYNDIYNHKKKFNQMEGKASSLQVNEIRCPYCRKKQIGVLPYYEELVKEKTNGVNFYDETETQCNNCFNQSFYNGKCEFIITPHISINSYIKPYKCSSSYVTKLEYDNKSYCYIHNRFMIKKIEKEKKENEKKLKEELKQKKKEEMIQKKNFKEELKQKKKEELIQKKNTKKELKQIVINSKQKILEENENENVILNSFAEDENIVVSSNIIINNVCNQIIKTGLNKGNQCGLPILSDCLCKRHYNLKNKINNINNNNINI